MYSAISLTLANLALGTRLSLRMSAIRNIFNKYNMAYLYRVNIVSKLFRLQFSNRCYRWIGPLNNMATLSSSGKEIFPQTVRSIESYFKQKEIQFQHGHTTIIAKCPFCATISSRESMTSAIEYQGSFSLFVNKTTGSHVCNSCGTSGTWNQLKV
jgi:hypothetical protein